MANTRFQHKRSSVSGVVPTTVDIASGELGINLADRRLFTSNGTAVYELGSNLTSLAVGNSTVRQIVNTTGAFVNGSINFTRNDTRLTFAPTAGGANVYFSQQADDNFVFYTTNTTGGTRAVFNVFANTNTPNQNSALRFNTPVDFSTAGVYANNSLGTSGQVLASNGTSVYWSTISAGVNTAAQFAWTNTHSFSANVAFNGSGIGIVSNTGAVYLGGLADANWRIGRNTGATTKSSYTNNTIDVIVAASVDEGFVIGVVGGNTVFETGYKGTIITGNVSIGNATVFTTVNATSFSGTASSANNASFLGGTAAASYQLNSTLAANVATMSANAATFSTISQGSGTGSTMFGLGTLVAAANQQGGRAYENHDFNTYPNLYSSVFINAGSSTNVPAGLTGMGYRFIMGAGDTTSRGFDLVGSSDPGLWFRERSTGTWNRVVTNSGTWAITANNATNLGGVAAASYQLNSTLSANVATMTANNSTNLNGQAASFYTNATNLSTGTVPTARLGSGTANSSTFLRGDQTWATPAASLPGGELFNINVSNATGYAVTAFNASAYVAPATAGLQYVVHSIQVTNISAANATISGEIQGTTYANTSFALTVPVPRESAVELLKMPKVLQPNGIIRLQANTASALHAYITVESISSSAYFGSGVDITADATFTDLHTATGNSVITSLLLSNDDGVNDVKARVVWTDGSNVIQGYLCFDMIIPADATVELLEKVKFLPNGHKIRVYANAGNRLEAIIAGKVL